MGGAFFGLNVALRGLYSSQRNLNIINHNLNNVNTPGYSRQVGIQQASCPLPGYNGKGMLGTGSEVVSIDRMRDEYLDYKYWSEIVSYGEWETKKTLLSEMEATFNEPSDSGFTTVFNDFYNSLQELAKDPGSPSVRAMVKQKAITLAKYFNSTASNFEKLQADINYRIRAKVEEINSLASQICQLNKQIYTAELDGSKANDLRDQRTLLVDKMAKIINVEANEVVVGKLANGVEDRRFVLTIGGRAIVDHYNFEKLALVQRDGDAKLNKEDIDSLYDIMWENGNSLDIKSGELRGLLDVRDGNAGKPGLDGVTKTPSYKGIPYYQEQLSNFVRIFAKAFNEGIIAGEKLTGHADGYGLDPDEEGPLTSATGIRFFTMMNAEGEYLSSGDFLALGNDIDEIYSNITAKNFSISKEILEDYNAIAASDKEGETGNIVVLNTLISMRHNVRMFTEGAPEDFMKSLITALGVDSQQAVRYTENMNAVLNQITSQRSSVSGVSIDEEMANMVRFQHTYNASARMITTIAELYDTLINMLGV
ncbi:MAG TPA: flagellar hook-associated protein FlgK [Clostridiaceae bacterium]|nr:flagellar hook-associated protein FlgK [Clostridiaceae bacterium]